MKTGTVVVFIILVFANCGDTYAQSQLGGIRNIPKGLELLLTLNDFRKLTSGAIKYGYPAIKEQFEEETSDKPHTYEVNSSLVAPQPSGGTALLNRVSTYNGFEFEVPITQSISNIPSIEKIDEEEIKEQAERLLKLRSKNWSSYTEAEILVRLMYDDHQYKELLQMIDTL